MSTQNFLQIVLPSLLQELQEHLLKAHSQPKGFLKYSCWATLIFEWEANQLVSLIGRVYLNANLFWSITQQSDYPLDISRGEIASNLLDLLSNKGPRWHIVTFNPDSLLLSMSLLQLPLEKEEVMAYNERHKNS